MEVKNTFKSPELKLGNDCIWIADGSNWRMFICVWVLKDIFPELQKATEKTRIELVAYATPTKNAVKVEPVGWTIFACIADGIEYGLYNAPAFWLQRAREALCSNTLYVTVRYWTVR